MDNNSLAIYVHELRNLCDHCVASFDIFNQAARGRNGPAILYAGQVVLIPVSQMAALIWPARARARARGEALRKVLGLKEEHVLNDRRVTELWERADERLEEWIARTKGQKVAFDFVGDPAQLKTGDGEGISENCIYRAFNPATRVYHYRGVGYNLQAIADAVADLQARVWAVYKQLFPEQAKAAEEARKKAVEAQQSAAADTPAADAPAADAPAADTAEAKTPAAKKTTARKPAAKKRSPRKTAAKTSTK